MFSVAAGLVSNVINTISKQVLIPLLHYYSFHMKFCLSRTDQIAAPRKMIDAHEYKKGL